MISEEIGEENDPLLLQLKNLLHQAPFLMTGQRWVCTLSLGHKRFPFGLAGKGGEAEHVAVEVKVVNGVHNHKDVGAAAEDLHVQDSDLFLAFHNFGPDVFVHVAVAPDHVRVVHQFKGLAVSFHKYFGLIRLLRVARNDKRHSE